MNRWTPTPVAGAQSWPPALPEWADDVWRTRISVSQDPPSKTEKNSYTLAKGVDRREIYMLVTEPGPSQKKWTARIRLPWDTPARRIEVHGSSQEEVIWLGVADLDRVLADKGWHRVPQ